MSLDRPCCVIFHHFKIKLNKSIPQIMLMVKIKYTKMKYFVEFDIQNTIKQEQESRGRIFHDELNRLKDNQSYYYRTAP